MSGELSDCAEQSAQLPLPAQKGALDAIELGGIVSVSVEADYEPDVRS